MQLSRSPWTTCKRPLKWRDARATSRSRIAVGRPTAQCAGPLRGRRLRTSGRIALRGRHIMNRTVLRSFAILSLWSCLSTHAPIAAPDTARAAGTKSRGTRPDIDVNAMFQHWVHSSEEEEPGGTVQVFRPAASMDFPPSRFRMAYKFAPNGGCEFHFLSPDDAHHFRPCHWTIGAGDKLILQIGANGESIAYRIVQLNGKILRLAPLGPRQNK
jgi:hypothetical protein